MGIVVIGAVFVDIKGFPGGQYIPQGRNVGWIEQVHGGVSRNVAEDIANVELRPTYVSLVDDNGAGAEVVRKLRSHKVNTDYVRTVKNGMGTWLAVFDHSGDVVGSISQRPDMTPLLELLEEKGDEIISNAESVVIEICLDKEIVKKVFKLAKKYNKPVYAVVANMSIAVQRRDFLQDCACFICNRQEAGILFSDDYSGTSIPDMETILAEKVRRARIPSMIITLGDKGAVYADMFGYKGWCPARNVIVKDTTGAGDAFCAGVAIGLTYGKTLAESCEIGSFLAASVIMTSENVCPRFLPSELGLDVEVVQDED
jgi:pseudouridine kinase